MLDQQHTLAFFRRKKASQGQDGGNSMTNPCKCCLLCCPKVLKHFPKENFSDRAGQRRSKKPERPSTASREGSWSENRKQIYKKSGLGKREEGALYMFCGICQDLLFLSWKRGSAIISHVQGLFLLVCEARMGEVGEGRVGRGVSRVSVSRRFSHTYHPDASR